GFIGNLVHSSPNIKKEVLHAGDQLRNFFSQSSMVNCHSCCTESQREAALLLGQFSSTDSDCKALCALRPLIGMLQSPDIQLKAMFVFALGIPFDV
ncbi:unnamed protein product, partial [Musa hybrid cultivar]